MLLVYYDLFFLLKTNLATLIESQKPEDRVLNSQIHQVLKILKFQNTARYVNRHNIGFCLPKSTAVHASIIFPWCLTWKLSECFHLRYECKLLKN